MKRMVILFARATGNHPGGAVASVTLMHAQDRLNSFTSLRLERCVNESGESPVACHEHQDSFWPGF
jgi:hypothetical protein